MLKDKKLDFFVVGVQKCATTWLHHCIKDHPQVMLPTKKLEVGYIGGKMFEEKGADWFFDRYEDKDNNKLIGDVSVDYIYDPNVPLALKPYTDNPKFILSLRNPVDRLVSAYFWFVRKRFLPDLPIEEGIKEILEQPIGFPNKLSDPINELVQRGNYTPQLQNLLKYYPAENVYVLAYERINVNNLDSIQRVFRFLEVDDSFVPPDLNTQHLKNTYNKTLLRIERLVDRKYLLGRIIGKAAIRANMLLAKYSEPKLDLSPKVRKRLLEQYAPQIQATKELLMSMPANSRPSDEYIKKMWDK